MKINVDKNIFLQSLSPIVGIIALHPTLPILSNILIETQGVNNISLTSTDMEIGISKNINGKVMEEGSITIPAKKLLDIIRELPNDLIDIETTKNNTVSITSGNAYIKLIGLSKEDFPVFPNFSDATGYEIDGKLLQECIRLTSFAISGDENKYVLNGSFVSIKDGILRMVSTDGRRLAYIKKDLDKKKVVGELNVILPTKTIYELDRHDYTTEDKIRIIDLKNQIVFKFKDGFIISRLIEGHFPDYERVIPTSKKLSAAINKNAYLSVVRRSGLFTSKEAQAVKFDFLKNKILVSIKSPTVGEFKEEIDAKIDGEPLSVGFNPAFVLDVLKNIRDENITLDITDVDKPGVFRREQNDYLCVIMPMQIT